MLGPKMNSEVKISDRTLYNIGCGLWGDIGLHSQSSLFFLASKKFTTAPFLGKVKKLTLLVYLA